MSPGCVSFFGPSGLLGLQVVGDCIGIMGRAKPALPSRECWIEKFGLLSRAKLRCPRVVLATAAGASRRIRVLRITCRCPRGHWNVSRKVAQSL
ncbi:hypothetical protein AXF42_Ash009225 [Apostasia shenzhenica]|uniref:Uncharacterized protein n=1 Tax=Apostasia shenzhenica TaxID=1088818 RepID=A0A2I0B3H2_9ASPA|nr:hypothetical protein AXF42_Ash009225 [Apostasia shenzhenica]